ncbi:hypothetical protein ABZ896_12535 [Streptomyces sp. NPDC047072]|uniref:hypothetical protein n=1 Tax=Streptomyces sp. NPDC047072 TaxID=3154809 RepID=UPI0033EFB142
MSAQQYTDHLGRPFTPTAKQRAMPVGSEVWVQDGEVYKDGCVWDGRDAAWIGEVTEHCAPGLTVVKVTDRRRHAPEPGKSGWLKHGRSYQKETRTLTMRTDQEKKSDPVTDDGHEGAL